LIRIHFTYQVLSPHVRRQLTVPADVWGKKLDLVICFSIWKQQWLKNHYLAQTGQLGRAPRQGELMFPEASQN